MLCLICQCVVQVCVFVNTYARREQQTRLNGGNTFHSRHMMQHHFYDHCQCQQVGYFVITYRAVHQTTTMTFSVGRGGATRTVPGDDDDDVMTMMGHYRNLIRIFRRAYYRDRHCFYSDGIKPHVTCKSCNYIT